MCVDWIHPASSAKRGPVISLYIYLLWTTQILFKMCCWNSLAVQWLGLHSFTAESMGLIPGQGTKILQAIRHGQNSQKKNCCLWYFLKFPLLAYGFSVNSRSLLLGIWSPCHLWWNPFEYLSTLKLCGSLAFLRYCTHRFIIWTMHIHFYFIHSC